jgi:hypothetical protein
MPALRIPGVLPWMAAPIAGATALATFPIGVAPTLCPFALVTGTACPGCGLTRAAAALVQGDFGTALSFHPLVFVVLAWALGWWVTGLARRRGKDLPLDGALVNRLLVATGVVFILTWVVRLAAGSLPPV